MQIGSVWAMRGGNANGNNNLRYSGPQNDLDQIQNTGLSGLLSMIITNTYAAEDVNMDGHIKANGPSNDQNFLLNTLFNGFLGLVYVAQL